MAEPVDLFADGFHVSVLPLGCILTFSRARLPLEPDPETKLFATEPVAAIRVTPEFLRGVTFLIRNQILQYERSSNIRIELPQWMMETMILTGTDQANWDRCWEYAS